MSAEIPTRIVCISGFTQTLARPTGIEKLWMKLRQFESPECRVSILEWDSNWESFAEHCFRTANGSRKDFSALICAYSWGVGYGFLKLANEFKKRGLKVPYAVLCDGVYHSGVFPWRAVMSPFWKPKIKIPSNVGEVWWFRQFENKPAGHDLVAEDHKSTNINDPTVLDVHHAWCDDSHWFHTQSVSAAKSLLENKT